MAYWQDVVATDRKQMYLLASEPISTTYGSCHVDLLLGGEVEAADKSAAAG